MEIREGEVGKGLFATKNYIKDEIIYKLTGEIFDHPTRESIHIGNNKHIYDEYGIFINHSFTPNIRVDNLFLIAIKDIHRDDELTFNYNETEINMANPFKVNDILVSGKKK
jgi:SET domain-containing protein